MLEEVRQRRRRVEGTVCSMPRYTTTTTRKKAASLLPRLHRRLPFSAAALLRRRRRRRGPHHNGRIIAKTIEEKFHCSRRHPLSSLPWVEGEGPPPCRPRHLDQRGAVAASRHLEQATTAFPSPQREVEEERE